MLIRDVFLKYIGSQYLVSLCTETGESDYGT